MVTGRGRSRTRSAGVATLELVAAMAILAAAILPLAFSIIAEQRLARAYYFRAVAMEIVDGEIEVLLAGEYRAFSSGTHPYKVRTQAAANLPPGSFVLMKNEEQLRLEWQPRQPGKGGRVTRLVRIPIAR